MNKALEDLQSGRNPYGRPPEPSDDGESYYRAARWCLWLPLIGGVFCKAVAEAVANVHGDARRWILIGAGGVFALMLLGSFVLGTIALLGIRKAGSEGILGKTLSGLTTSSVLLFVFIQGVRSGYQTQAMARTLEESRQQLQSDMKKEIESGEGISVDKQDLRLQKIILDVDAAAQNVSGQDALLARAGSACLSRIQGELKNYASAVKALQSSPPLDLSGVQRREQLEEKRKVVKNFMAANERLLAFTTNQESIFREELQKLSVPAPAQEAALKGFRRSAESHRASTEGIRDDDRRCAAAMLGILDLADANWGKWTWNAARKKIVFDSPLAQDKYIEYRDEIEAAAREQAKLQLQILNGKQTTGQ